MTIPPGFERSARSSPFLDLIGPIHTLDDERGIVIGLEVRTDHLNGRGRLHGAVVAALADVVLGRNAAAGTESPTPLVTANLNIDFIAGAAAGDWVEATAEATHVGRRLGFARAVLYVDGRIIAQASGVFAVVERR
jgi:acyl-coenzyme A thioesterase 13